MTLEATYTGEYVVTCGDRFEAAVTMGRCVVTREAGGIETTDETQSGVVMLEHARQILSDRGFSITSEIRGEPTVIWPRADWDAYARDDFVLPP